MRVVKKGTQRRGGQEAAKKIALLGILGAQALALSFLEGLLPPLLVLPPGAKPGLSNIITMFTAMQFGFPEAMAITLLKAAFAGLTRGLTAGCMSLSGGLLSTAALCLLLRMKRKPFGLSGVSVLCALSHNAGQLCVYAALAGTVGIFYMAPVLLLFSVVTGLVTGLLLKALTPVLNRQKNLFQ